MLETRRSADPLLIDRRWRFPWTHATAAVVLLLGICVMLYPQAASWFSQRAQSRVTELAMKTLEQPPNNSAVARQEQLAAAHHYNDALASGAFLKANERKAVGEGTSADDALDYNSMLAVTSSGFMGRLRYDRLDIDLPIYHGTSDETLERGIGHLEGTSLPVGGVGTRTVLTAHRGLPEAILFTDLDRAAVGDLFTISVMGEVLTYRVIESQVIEPSETKAIIPDPDRDLATLVTCTPLGINTHRILVTGERVTPTPLAEIDRARQASDLPGFPWWAVILGGATVLLALYVWRGGYPRRRR